MYVSILLLALLTLGTSFPVAADPAPPPEIEVYGNRYLKESAIIEMSGLKPKPAMSLDEVRKRLQTSGLFSTVSVSREDDEIIIRVREKTTWFALPYFSTDPSATLYGLAFGQASVFGQDASMVGRLQAGTSDREASILMKSDAFFVSPWIVGGSLDYEDSLHWVYYGRNLVQSTRNKYHGGSIQTGYHFYPYFYLELNNYIEQHHFQELDGSMTSGFQWSHKLIGEYNHFYVNEGLSEGGMVQAYYESANLLSDFKFTKWGISSQAGLFLHGNFNWIVRGTAEWSPALPRYQLFELGGASLRGFPAEQFRDRGYAEAQNDLLVASLPFWRLNLRPLIYADWAFVTGSAREAIGTGFYLYVRGVVIPAVQFFIGHGFNPDEFTASIAIGPQVH